MKVNISTDGSWSKTSFRWAPLCACDSACGQPCVPSTILENMAITSLEELINAQHISGLSIDF
jgi:hypothetical protein